MIKMVETKILKPSPENIETTGKIIRNGGLVAFPTETVYGIGADGLNETACRKIFEVKERPPEKALSLHVASFEMIEKVAEIDSAAKKLFKAFCPGPLTVILPKKNIVPDFVTGGLKTVGIRFPDNRTALELIKNAGCPVAASSANISGKNPPKNAAEVFENLGGKIPVILDGGDCKFGKSSTVVDISSGKPKFLRIGSVAENEILKILNG